jgi:hypothetical protein
VWSVVKLLVEDTGSDVWFLAFCCGADAVDLSLARFCLCEVPIGADEGCELLTDVVALGGPVKVDSLVAVMPKPLAMKSPKPCALVEETDINVSVSNMLKLGCSKPEGSRDVEDVLFVGET